MVPTRKPYCAVFPVGPVRDTSLSITRRSQICLLHTRSTLPYSLVSSRITGFDPQLNTSHAGALTGIRKLGHASRPRAPVSTNPYARVDRAENRYSTAHAAPHYWGCAAGTFLYSEYLQVEGGRDHYTLEVHDVQMVDIADRPINDCKMLCESQSTYAEVRQTK